MTNCTILHFETDVKPATNLANLLDLPIAEIKRHRFPDGESQVQLTLPLPPHIIIYQSLHHPNEKLVELLLCFQTARQHGVERISLIAPYLCYMRQDMEFEPGQAVSQQIIGHFLAQLVDDIITVDPHLHRIDNLQQAIPIGSAHSLTAAALMAEFITETFENPLLVGPDSESEQWVQLVAAPGGFDYIIASKSRHGDRDVSITLPDYACNGRHAILIDDVISSGRTLAMAAEALSERKVASISAICTHALLEPGADALLSDHGITHLYSCDSIPHSSNHIPLASLLAACLQRLLAKSVIAP